MRYRQVFPAHAGMNPMRAKLRAGKCRVEVEFAKNPAIVARVGVGIHRQDGGRWSSTSSLNAAAIFATWMPKRPQQLPECAPEGPAMEAPAVGVEDAAASVGPTRSRNFRQPAGVPGQLFHDLRRTAARNLRRPNERGHCVRRQLFFPSGVLIVARHCDDLHTMRMFRRAMNRLILHGLEPAVPQPVGSLLNVSSNIGPRSVDATRKEDLVLICSYRQTTPQNDPPRLPRSHASGIDEEGEDCTASAGHQSFGAILIGERPSDSKRGFVIGLQHDDSGYRACFENPITARVLFYPLTDVVEIVSCLSGRNRLNCCALHLRVEGPSPDTSIHDLRRWKGWAAFWRPCGIEGLTGQLGKKELWVAVVEILHNNCSIG